MLHVEEWACEWKLPQLSLWMKSYKANNMVVYNNLDAEKDLFPYVNVHE